MTTHPQPRGPSEVPEGFEEPAGPFPGGGGDHFPFLLRIKSNTAQTRLTLFLFSSPSIIHFLTQGILNLILDMIDKMNVITSQVNDSPV